MTNIDRTQQRHATLKRWVIVAWIIIADGVYLRFCWPDFLELLRAVGHLGTTW